jgi:TRAP-type C4-dicarboxylate transport system substrate-binding protein
MRDEDERRTIRWLLPTSKEETMTTTKLLRALVAAVAIGLSAASLGAAAGPPDKSGGSGAASVQLTLMDENDSLSGEPAVQRFIDRVHELSNGTITITVDNVNDGYAGAEQRVVAAVRAGKTAQLAWVGTRVWDLEGVKSFQALSAPMLIDSYKLQKAVLQSDLRQKMLAGLDGHGLVGLALLGDNLRYPAGTHPLRGPEDFRGLRIRVYPSATQAAAMRALGAKPSPENWKQLPPAFKTGRLSALEIDLNTYQSNAYSALAPYVTLNLPLWPRTTVVFANAGALAALSDQQRAWIQQAAADAEKYSLTTFGEDPEIIPMECRMGMKAVLASPGQIAALHRAFAPVYASLRTDPATAGALEEIEALKKRVGRAAPPAIPAGCGTRASVAAASEPAFPQGVFRGKRTRQDILRVWPNVDSASIKALAAIMTFRFEKGRFDLVLAEGGDEHCRHGDGRYELQGKFLVVWFDDLHGCPGIKTPSDPTTLRWTYDGKTLRFSLAKPTGPLSVATWTAIPFVRIG